MERFDIYDQFGNKTGKVVPHDYKLKNGEYRFICHVCIFDNDKMLIQKRGLNKIDFPGCWDISCGGGVNTEETSYQAILREAKEELGIEIKPDQKYYMRIFYPKGFDDYYILNQAICLENLTLRDGEVLDAKWASKEEILEMMKKQEFVTYASGFIDILFSFSKQRGSYIK